MSLIVRGILYFAVLLLLQICQQSAHCQEDTFDSVLKRATEKAATRFRRTKRAPNKDFDFGNPPEARGLVYAEALKIVPKVSIVENEGTGYSPFPRRGTAWEKMRIFLQAEADGEYSEYKYDSDLVDYRSTDIKPPLPQRIPRSVQHWTEVGIYSPADGGFPQLVNMRANGYMRLASSGTVYGHSERGFVEQTALDSRDGTRVVRERFPIMTEVFLAYPSHQSATVYQILENETAVLARRLEISMNGDTVMKVTGRIIPRKGKKISDKHNIGMAHISMYWKGSREGAENGEHAHDSDTVGVTYEDGTQHAVDILPGYSRSDKRKFRFIDLYQSESKMITGYSLEQRDRNAEHYVPDVDYHMRASMVVSDMKWSVPTQTQLVVLPDDGEFFDNVVLRTVIRPNAPTSKAVGFSYTETIAQLKTP